MKAWIFILAGVLTIALLFFLTASPINEEGFLTVDLNTALTQRQQQQFEGERRYTDFARVQNPKSRVTVGQVEAALQQEIPVATNNTESLLSLLGAVQQGATAPPSKGSGVEQTGAVQEKIDFCESLKTVDCNLLDDPRMAECGFCHRNGTDSAGRPHRGGMFISSDDQIRANELSTANGNTKAIYIPTVGKCRPVDFTLSPATCEARERHLECERAGAATSANKCGQCYGGAPAGTTGLLYMGNKPRKYTAVLHISHPGMHAPFQIQFEDGRKIFIPKSKLALLDPKEVRLELNEGERLTFVLSGVPSFWCGWFSSPDGNRVVSLDIAIDTFAPANGIVIAGDKRSITLNKAMAQIEAWGSFKAKTPNTVLWYRRRDDALPGAIVRAIYEANTPTGNQPVDVTDNIYGIVAQNLDVSVAPEALSVARNPAMTGSTLYIIRDNGTQLAKAGGDTFEKRALNSTVSMNLIVPATLADPYYREDAEFCPTGPMVLTAEGAGRLGANSCFKIDGSFNPSVFCLQRLWAGAGAEPKGRLYPNTAAAAAALAKPTLDETMNMFNNQVNIALYGVDMGGGPQEFETIRKASMDYFGIDMRNPCDGPNAQRGPHTPECLDYLLRTSGNAGQDGVAVDRKKLPYAYCNTDGWTAPINSNGSVNTGRVEYYNSLGAIPNVRAAMQGIYNSAHDSRDFPAQKWAMKACYGAKLEAPKEDQATCPPPNSEEWQCFPVDKIPTNVVDPRAVPAFRFDRTYGRVVGLSTTGGPIHVFPSTDACLEWTRGPKNNPAPNGVNQDQPFLTQGYADAYIKGRV